MLEEANICYKVKTNLTSADWFFAAASALIFPKHFSHKLSSKDKDGRQQEHAKYGQDLAKSYPDSSPAGVTFVGLKRKESKRKGKGSKR